MPVDDDSSSSSEEDDDEYDGIPDEDIWNIKYQELTFHEEIAQGSFGKVLRGGYLGLEVAIKQIFRHNDPAYMKYIEREISVLKSLRHPFVVNFLGVCLHKTGLYIVTEYVKGGDVRALLKDNKPGTLDWSRKIQFSADLARTMYYLHSKKILHRDLKCKNLLIGNDGKLRLCDFGFARVSDAFESRKRTMTVCGTPGFVAPEVMLGQEYNDACDVFSFGNVMAEFITHKRPGRDFWKRHAKNNYLLDIQQVARMAPSSTPKAYLELCMASVSYNQTERPSFSTIVEKLDAMQADSSMYVTAPQQVQPFGSRAAFGAHRISQDQQQLSQLVEKSSNKNSAPEQESKLDLSIKHLINVTEDLRLSSTELAVSAKHLMKMVKRATHPEVMENEFVQDLLLCYPCFSFPQTLLKTVRERWMEASESQSQTQDPESRKKNEMAEMRTLVFLNTWISTFPHDFTLKEMQSEIDLFDTNHSIMSEQNKRERFSIRNALTSRFNSVKRHHLGHMRPDFLSQGLTAQPVPYDVDYLLSHEMDALRWAQQITLVDQAFFISIKPREYLKESWKKLKDSNIFTFTETSDQLGRWAATAILLAARSSKTRGIQMISRLIDVANYLITLKSFNALFGLCFGFLHPSVERLTDCFSQIDPARSSMLQDIKVLTDKKDQYKLYREKQDKITPPTVPFLFAYLDEISYIDGSSPDVGNGGIINFSKHRKLSSKIRYLEGFSKVGYDFLPHPPMKNHLLRCTLLTDDELLKASHGIQPPVF